MSRIGRKPIPLLKGVEITVTDANLVTVKGPKGILTQQMPELISIEKSDAELNVIRSNDERQSRALHGLTRSLLNNMVVGVTQGFQRVLEISGVGYRANREGKNIVLQVGFSHPIRIVPPEGIVFEVMDRRSANEPQQVIVRGIDKQLVGEEAAKIRGLRPPEPYKGYGIRYQGEKVRRKAGKAGKAK
jgi:large subunit ribosomal protein L6